MAVTALSLRGMIRGLFGHANATTELKTYVDNMFKPKVQVVKAAIDAAASTVTAEYTFYVADRNLRVLSVKYVPSTAVTAGATHFATLLVDKRPLSGPGTPVNVATRSLAATDMVAFTRETWTLSSTAADLLLVPGDALTFEITKTMNGLAVPAGTVTVEVEEV